MTTATIHAHEQASNGSDCMPIADGMISATRWDRGRPPRPISLDQVRPQGGVLCFSVESGADPELVFQTLHPSCEGLSFEMVEDLLCTDDLPSVGDYGGGAIRKVSAFGTRAVEPSEGGDEGVPGSLVFELVEFLANDEWLIVCCHEAESFAGARASTRCRAEGGARLIRSAAYRWQQGEFGTAGDLGLLMLHELTCTYSKVRRTLLTWLERWELHYYRTDRGDQETLVTLRGLAAEFRARLNALNRPRDEVADGWFKGISDHEIERGADRHIDRTLSALDRLSDMLRSSFELLHSQSTAAQLKLAQTQARKTEDLQERIEKLTSAFLVPTLIAGFFGANTALPGGNGTHSWMSFELMVISMILGVFIAWHGLGWFRNRERRRLEIESFGG